ncbi:hypothetical protein ACEQ8H_001140 [Pleosporales sp. CAS-2024a]
MSAPAIEARSLSSLTALASNPPAYPRNPTHVRNDPLVLYIARVPGSKDVFLSPMKPRQKVVTAEDITSSLYFLHVEQPEDANLVESPQFRAPDYQENPSTGSHVHVFTVQRKAVPGASSLPPRKPVSGTLAPVYNYGNQQNLSAGRYSQQSGILAPDSASRQSHENHRFPREDQQSTASLERNPPVGTFLTLIRRDPSSGAQWNVARIEDPSIAEISSSTLDGSAVKRKVGQPLYIEIMNPGYSKFLQQEDTNRPALPSRPSDVSARNHQLASTLHPHIHTPVLPEQTTPRSTTFQRRLWMEGTQYASGGFGHRKNNSYDFNTGRPDSRGSYDTRTESSPFEKRAPPPMPFLARDDQLYGTIQVSDRPTSFRGYVFMSPWNGRCEFTTGAGGGSLKCRHIVPGPPGALPVAMSVSELRFNLPSSSMPTTPKGEESSKRSSFFHRGRHSRNNSSLSVNPEEIEDTRRSMDRLDLSLGQELAGGGFGGKQAKLGKIILDDEGLKMIDLLVAANLALWWRAYEKASAPLRGNRGSF